MPQFPYQTAFNAFRWRKNGAAEGVWNAPGPGGWNGMITQTANSGRYRGHLAGPTDRESAVVVQEVPSYTLEGAQAWVADTFAGVMQSQPARERKPPERVVFDDVVIDAALLEPPDVVTQVAMQDAAARVDEVIMFDDQPPQPQRVKRTTTTRK